MLITDNALLIDDKGFWCSAHAKGDGCTALWVITNQGVRVAMLREPLKTRFRGFFAPINAIERDQFILFDLHKKRMLNSTSNAPRAKYIDQ